MNIVDDRYVPALTLLLCAVSGSAAAEELRREITPFAAYRFGGTFSVESSQGEYELDDSASSGIILNLRQYKNTQWELLYSQQRSEARIDGVTINDPVIDIDTHTLQLGGTYQGPEGDVRPYVALTLGGTRIEASSRGKESDTFLSGSIGVGLQIRPSERLGIRVEARAYGALVDSETELLCRTGPDLNICAIRIEGDVLSQIETFAGLVFRF